MSYYRGCFRSDEPRATARTTRTFEDGTVRVSGAEILSRIVREAGADHIAVQARGLLQSLQQDSDHRVVGAVLNGLQVS